MGIKNGISIVTFGVQAALDANPDFGCIQGDIKNGYNEVSRASVLDEIRSHASLSNTLAFSHALMEPAAYVGMGGGCQLITAPFKCKEGVHQGAVESGFYFSIACNPSFQELNDTLAVHGGAVVESLMITT